VVDPDGRKIDFEYDALGRRTAKIIQKTITRYLWDGNVLLHEWSYPTEARPLVQISELGEVSYAPEPAENVTTWLYDEGAYTPIGKLINGERYSIVSDYIGRPIQCFNDTGEIIWETEYDLYGRLKNLQGERAFIPFRQQGQYEDVDLGGLYYNRFRYYDSGSGVYLSQDPIGLAGGMNLYGYVHDSNIWVDVFGLSPNPFDIVPYRPSNFPLENHHGILDIWAEKNIQGYKSRAPHNPTMALTKEQHDATKIEYRRWLKEKTGKPVGGKVDWTKVSASEAKQLSERMFDAAQVPQQARNNYYKRFNRYIKSGCK
jgi:RHS repeat-associated protein